MSYIHIHTYDDDDVDDGDDADADDDDMLSKAGTLFTKLVLRSTLFTKVGTLFD